MIHLNDHGFLVGLILFTTYIYNLESVSVSRRILNGNEVPAQDGALKYPFMVSILEKEDDKYYLIGGGSILNENYVLSAAHIMNHINNESSSEIYILAGTLKCGDMNAPNVQFIKATPTFHPNWQQATVQNDIVMFHLEQPLVFDNYVNKIDMVDRDYVASGSGTIMGCGSVFNQGSWDEIKPENLMETEIPISDFADCNTRMKGLLNETNQICLGYHHPSRSCFGDSGGPFIQEVEGQKKLVGVISIAVTNYLIENGTLRAVCVGDVPMAVAKVATYRDFIDSILG